MVEAPVVVCDTMLVDENPPWQYTDYRKALVDVDVDACIVATPPSSHFEISKACLEAGKDVLVEKPMTLDHSEAVDLCGLAQSKNLTLMTDDTFMYTDWVREHFPERSGGARFYTPRVDFVSLDWSNPRAETPEEGILWTLGPHPVSLALRLMRRLPSTHVEGVCLDRSTSFYLRFGGGDRAAIAMSWRTTLRTREMIYGTVDGIGVVNFDKLTQEPDPLTVMCQTFLERVGKAWIDTHGLEVVMVLHSTAAELALESPNSSQNGHPA